MNSFHGNYFLLNKYYTSPYENNCGLSKVTMNLWSTWCNLTYHVITIFAFFYITIFIFLILTRTTYLPEAVFLHKPRTTPTESGLDIVQSFPFTHVAPNRDYAPTYWKEIEMSSTHSLAITSPNIDQLCSHTCIVSAGHSTFTFSFA